MSMSTSKELDELAVENFRTYLRFSTVHPDPDYTDAVDWLRNQGVKMGLECFLTEIVAKNPILIMRWPGSDPSLRSIMLNSHMDVVPVEREKWAYDPFAAEMSLDGNIYGRGAQDMKSVGIQQLEAVRRLKLEGFVPKRTIYLTFLPDEEVGGGRGMQPFVSGVKPNRPGAPNEISFAEMNVGLCLDEGIACPRPDVFYAFYEERSPWWVSFLIPGNAGHGSRFIEDTAVEKLHRLMDRLLAFRDSEKKKLELIKGNDLALGGVVTSNINVIKGGIEPNVVPAEIEVQVDFRLPPTLDFDAFEQQIHKWADESGEGIKINYIQKDMSTTGHGNLSGTYDASDPVLEALKSSSCLIGAHLEVGVFFGSTDARFLRRWHKVHAGEKPIKAYGFSPMCDVPVLLHDHDEYLNKKTFLDGVRVTFLSKDMGTYGHGSVDIPIDSHPNDVWWNILEDVLSRRSIGLQTGISGGSNDGRYLRQYHRLCAPDSKPIKAISFSPLRNTRILHHASNEFVSRKAFLEGVQILAEIVQMASSVERQEDDA
uniref:N-acyl-aliphatic-L-amino acid amidohydrolase n=1 Tax=Echinococcus canadensis TaxID=519352 RepID=A0A915EY35_9CEST